MTNVETILALAKSVLKTEARAILRLCSRIDENNFYRACKLLFECQGRIVVTGIGKPGHIAKKIAATLASTGSPAFFMHPSEAVHGDLGMITKRDAVLAISNSGNTEELLQIIPTIKLIGAPLVSITGNLNSSLAKMSDVVLDASVEREACSLGVVPTASTTAALALGDALAVALLEARGFTCKDFARSHPGGILGKRLLTKVDDLMRTGDNIPQVTEDTTIAEALIEITNKRMGMTIVVDAEQKLLVGIFTDGDLRRVLDKNLNLNKTKIATVMTNNCKTLRRGILAAEAVKVMEQYQITALAIVDEHNVPCGVVHLHDLISSGLL